MGGGAGGAQVGVQEVHPINPLDQPSYKPNDVAIEPIGISAREKQHGSQNDYDDNFDNHKTASQHVHFAEQKQNTSFQESFDLYNATAAKSGWKQADYLTAAQERKFTELSEYYTFNDWKDALNCAARSTFIAEKKRENWPSLDWFLKPDKFVQLLEQNDHEIAISSSKMAECKTLPQAQQEAAQLIAPVAPSKHRPVSLELKRLNAARNASVPLTEADADRLQLAAWRQNLADAERLGEVELAATVRAMIDTAPVPAIH